MILLGVISGVNWHGDTDLPWQHMIKIVLLVYDIIDCQSSKSYYFF